ncbi:kinase, partial [Thraustotheca clavata]
GGEIVLPIRSPATSTSSEKKEKAPTQSLLTQLSQRDDLKPLWMFIETLKTTTIKGGHNLFSCNVSGSKVALKGMDYPAASQESRMNFIKAIHFIQQVRSPYVTRLTGVCLMNFQTRLCVVSEYMDKGCLGAIATDANIEISEENKYKICHGMASGIAYLHPKRAYGHLTNEKVLINSEFDAKLNVFELMKKYYLESRYVTSSFGSFEVVYQAPELRKVSGAQYSIATDIYALGVLMAEIFVRERPYKKLYEEKGFLGGDVYLYEHPTIQPFVLDSRIPEGIRELIEQCWHENPSNRPNVSQIVDQLAKNVPSSA